MVKLSLLGFILPAEGNILFHFSNQSTTISFIIINDLLLLCLDLFYSFYILILNSKI